MIFNRIIIPYIYISLNLHVFYKICSNEITKIYIYE